MNTTNGTLALKLTILKSFNDSSVTLDQISILNISSNSGGGVKTIYRVFFNSVTPKATYNKLVNSLNNSITSGLFTDTLRTSAQQLNVPGVTNVVATSFNVLPLGTASPPTAIPSFAPMDMLTANPSLKPTVHPTFKPSPVPVRLSSVPSKKPVYKYPTKKPLNIKTPTIKPVYKYPT